MRYAILLTTASLGASIGWSLGESAGTGLSILLGLETTPAWGGWF